MIPSVQEVQALWNRMELYTLEHAPLFLSLQHEEAWQSSDPVAAGLVSAWSAADSARESADLETPLDSRGRELETLLEARKRVYQYDAKREQAILDLLHSSGVPLHVLNAVMDLMADMETGLDALERLLH